MQLVISFMLLIAPVLRVRLDIMQDVRLLLMQRQ